jgi:protein TonB
MRLVTAMLPALFVTLVLFCLMQYLIGSSRPGLTRPDYPGFVSLIRLTPDTDQTQPPAATRSLPERDSRSAETPSAPLPALESIEPPPSTPLSVALPEQIPLDLGDGPTLEPFDPARIARDSTVDPSGAGNAVAENAAPAASGDPTTELGDAGSSGDVIALFRVEPAYPRKAARNGDEGWVKLEFTITEQGTVVDAVVLDARPRRTFNRSAIAAIRQWRFKPRVVGGRPVPVRATQVIEFNLAGR